MFEPETSTSNTDDNTNLTYSHTITNAQETHNIRYAKHNKDQFPEFGLEDNKTQPQLHKHYNDTTNTTIY